MLNNKNDHNHNLVLIFFSTDLRNTCRPGLYISLTVSPPPASLRQNIITLAQKAVKLSQ